MAFWTYPNRGYIIQDPILELRLDEIVVLGGGDAMLDRLHTRSDEVTQESVAPS